MDDIESLRAKYGVTPAPTGANTSNSSSRLAELDAAWAKPKEDNGVKINPVSAVAPVDLTKPILSAGKEALNTISTEFGGGEQGIAQKLGRDISEGAKDIQSGNVVKGVAKAGLRTAGDVAGAVYTPISAAVGGVMKATGAQSAIDWIGKQIAEKSGIADNKAFQDWAMAHPNAAEDFGRALNLIMAAGEKGKIEPSTALERTKTQIAPAIEGIKNTVKPIVKSVVEPITQSTTPGAKQVTTPNDTNFQSKVDKAFPVLKNDVRNLPKKYENAKTAFTDIAENKDSLGLIDKNGKARTPETFVENSQVQNTRMKDIYKEYSSKLEGVDKQKFDTDIQSSISKQIENIKGQLEKENSTSGRRALSNKLHEISSLRDTSPEGIQNYIETLNQEAKTAPGSPLSVAQVKAANLAGDMRKVLDNSVEKIDGTGYQDLRSKYGAHRAMQDQFLMAAKKEINATPGLTDKLANLGVSAEGLNFLITHNPQALIVAGGIKGTSMFTKWLNSPQRALKGIYEGVESGSYKTPAPLSPK
uniref:Uncharacterized protein n=1 Tax=uncultured marine virus TaxID=186617 RepID=A0A0F7L8V5_9VIRU|nr:hypothetical protein [uncultured marine virus]